MRVMTSREFNQDVSSAKRAAFWRDNADPASFPPRLAEMLPAWQDRPPGLFDFALDTESFAYFNYHYVLHGMDFATAGAADPAGDAARQFARIRTFGECARAELPPHRALIERMIANA